MTHLKVSCASNICNKKLAQVTSCASATWHAGKSKHESYRL